MKRRPFLAGAGSVALLSVSGCLNSVFDSSENEEKLLSQYEQAYEHHEDGLRHLDNGFRAFESDNLDRTEIRFEDAASAFGRAEDAYGLDQIELVSEVFGNDPPLAHREATQAITRGATASSLLVNDVQTVQRGGAMAEPSRDNIRSTRTDYGQGEFEMPPVPDFEDAL